MTAEPDFDVAVIGAGIVGASTALWVQRDGSRVVLLDSGLPGRATSYGNACTIANYACIPINSPSIFRRLPRLLFSRDSPLRVDWRYALGHLPWQLEFLRNCTRRRVDEISEHLGKLLALTDAGLDPLLQMSDTEDCVAEARGAYYVYSTESGYRSAAEGLKTRRRFGARIKELSEAEFRELEPGVIVPVHRALLFEDVRYLRNPCTLVERYVDRFTGDGGDFVQSRVFRVAPDGAGVIVHMADESTLTCRHLVVAAGAWSKSIRGSGSEHLPLDTERGYHVLFKRHGGLLRRPVGWMDGGFYAVPMEHGLRLAGTVELAGLSEKQNQDRIDYLTRCAHKMFGDIGEPDETWLGFRPTFPDALPVIGRSDRSDKILFAFGHQHVGLTLGGATGMIIADLIAGRSPPIDLAPYSPARFKR